MAIRAPDGANKRSFIYLSYISSFIHWSIAAKCLISVPSLLSPKTNTPNVAPYWPQEGVIDPYKIQRPIEYFALPNSPQFLNMEIYGPQLIQSSEIGLDW